MVALTDICLDSGKKYKPSSNIARSVRCFHMTKTFPELPNQAHTFPLSSDISLQVFLVGSHSPNTGINHFADFLEAQGISVEKATTPTKVKVPSTGANVCEVNFYFVVLLNHYI